MQGVEIKELVVHRDERGELFEIFRSDDRMFMKFGQAYITKCYGGWVKGWHFHKKQSDFFCVVRGQAKIVLFDRREDSPSKGEIKEVMMNSESPSLLKIPPGVIHGFEAIGDECWILNIPDHVYDPATPDEFRLALDSQEVPYEAWKGRQGW